MNGYCVPFVLQPGKNPFKPYIRIPEGMYAVVQTNGADIPYGSTGSKIWPAGFHWVTPFITKVEYLVTKQSVVFDAPVNECKTADDVSVAVDTTLNLRCAGEDPEKIIVVKLPFFFLTVSNIPTGSEVHI